MGKGFAALIGSAVLLTVAVVWWALSDSAVVRTDVPDNKTEPPMAPMLGHPAEMPVPREQPTQVAATPSLPTLDCAAPPADVLRIEQWTVPGVDFCQRLQTLEGAQPPPPATAWHRQAKALRDALVDEELVRRALTKDGLAVTDADIDAELAKKLENSKTAGLAPPNASALALVRQQLRARLEFERLLASRAPGEVTLTEMQAAYAKDPGKYGEPAAAMLAPFLVRVANTASADEVEAARKKAQAFADAVAKGAAAEAAAKTTGVAGSPAFELQAAGGEPELATAAMQIAPGQWTRPVRTKVGWVVARLESARPGAIEAFDKVKDKIKAQLQSQHNTTDREAILTALRKDAKVEDFVTW